MELSPNLLCLFSAEISTSNDSYVIEVPKRELEAGELEAGERYRVAMIAERETAKPTDATAGHEIGEPQPPVEVGETRYVEIEDLGKQGDGIARVERGYVIIVPDVEVGDRVKIEVADVKPNFAVAEVLESEPVS